MKLSRYDLQRLAAQGLAGFAKSAAAKPKRTPKPLTAEQIQAVNAWANARQAEPGIFAPVRCHNRANGSHGNPHAIARERKAIRDAIGFAVVQCPRTLPVRVKLTRYGAGRMDTHDGLRNALKPVADAVADHFDVKDNDPRIAFEYDQKPAPVRCHGVRVEFTTVRPGCSGRGARPGTGNGASPSPGSPRGRRKTKGTNAQA